jgi:hypothetical protein
MVTNVNIITIFKDPTRLKGPAHQRHLITASSVVPLSFGIQNIIPIHALAQKKKGIPAELELLLGFNFTTLNLYFENWGRGLKEPRGRTMASYLKGPVTAIDSSSSPIPCNLSLLVAGSDEVKSTEGRGAMFGVIHKHFVTVGQLGSDPSSHRLISYGKLEEKSPSSHLTQVRSIHIH